MLLLKTIWPVAMISILPWASDDNHLLMVYYAGGLLQDKEKRYSTGLLPERKKELDELLKNIKEDDNPVVILVTLKPKKDNKQ